MSQSERTWFDNVKVNLNCFLTRTFSPTSSNGHCQGQKKSGLNRSLRQQRSFFLVVATDTAPLGGVGRPVELPPRTADDAASGRSGNSEAVTEEWGGGLDLVLDLVESSELKRVKEHMQGDRKSCTARVTESADGHPFAKVYGDVYKMRHNGVS